MNYDKYITFSRYNEPLVFPTYLKKACEYIKRELPEVKLITNTNGDFLDNWRFELPIDEISIMDYDNRGLDWCRKRLKACGCTIDAIEEPYIYAHYKDMKILYFTNWSQHCIINNRGGSLPEYNKKIRDYKCTEPNYFIGINYDGTVSPCCNIRNDIESHRDYILGDLNKNSLEEILESNKRKDFILNCNNAVFEEKSPCYQCLNTGGRYTKEKGGIRYE